MTQMRYMKRELSFLQENQEALIQIVTNQDLFYSYTINSINCDIIVCNNNDIDASLFLNFKTNSKYCQIMKETYSSRR